MAPRSTTAGESSGYTRAFVVLMVLTGLLGTILTTTLYFLAENWVNNLGPPTSSSTPASNP